MSLAPASFLPMTLGRWVRFAAKRQPSKLALHCEGRRLAYGELVGRMNRAANAARGLGLQPGDVVALVAPNRLEYIEIVIGLADAGLVVATLNPRLTAAELSTIFDDCRPR